MGRNLNRRVELMFPVENPTLAEEIRREALDIALRDNVAARILQSDGQYARLSPGPGAELLESQRMIIRARTERARAARAIPRDSP